MAVGPLLHAAAAAVVPLVLSGCGNSPSVPSSTTPSPTPGPSPSPPPGPPSSCKNSSTAPGPATGLPELHVPFCGNDGSSMATTQGYFVTNVDGNQHPTWDAVTQICWNADGITIETNNTDCNIFQDCDACGCDNYNQGDVAETFLGPVSDPYAVPTHYYELDVGAVTGSFWGGIVNNSLGNDTVYPSVILCDAAPDPGGFASCELNCSGTLPDVTVDMGVGWWSRRMVVPWSLFEDMYTPAGNGGQPWQHWRGNFYRYSYPHDDHDTHELSGWSPTHDASFHRPEMFGSLTFLPSTAFVAFV